MLMRSVRIHEEQFLSKKGRVVWTRQPNVDMQAEVMIGCSYLEKFIRPITTQEPTHTDSIRTLIICQMINDFATINLTSKFPY